MEAPLQSMAEAVEFALLNVKGEFTTATIKAIIESQFPGCLSEKDRSAISSIFWRLAKAKKSAKCLQEPEEIRRYTKKLNEKNKRAVVTPKQ